MSAPETPQNPPPEGMPPSQPAYPQFPAPGQPSYPQPYPPASQPYPPAPPPGYVPPSQPYSPYAPAGQPGYPTPSQPYPPQGQPGYPMPSQPYGQPSTPYPLNPSQPYPAYAPDGQMIPWPVGPDGQPLAAQVPPQTATPWGQLWPFWVWLVGGAVLALLAIVLFASGSDWAAGAQMAGLGLVVGAVALLATLGIRAAGGLFATTNARRTSQIIGTGLAAVLLLAVAGVGIGAQNPIHVAQAHTLESAKNYARAISEYQLGNAGAADLARTYNEWGEQLLASGQSTLAIAKFDTVITVYGSDTAQVTRARTGEAKAYSRIGNQALSAGSFADAVTAFTTLTTKFPNDPAAVQAHAPFAQALLGLAKSQLSGGGAGCTTALPTYQQLADGFSDTPEGQQAATALKAPEPVRGQFTGTITPPSGQVALALLGSISGTTFTVQYGATISTTDGQFQFTPVPLGTYTLGVAFGTVSGTQATPTQLLGVLVDQGGNPLPIKTVPLCGTDIGTIPGNITAYSVAAQFSAAATQQTLLVSASNAVVAAATRWRDLALVTKQH